MIRSPRILRSDLFLKNCDITSVVDSGPMEDTSDARYATHRHAHDDTNDPATRHDLRIAR